jgi:hypothetical protein
VGWRLKGDRRIIRPILVFSATSCLAFFRLQRLLTRPAAAGRVHRVTGRCSVAKVSGSSKLIVSYAIDHIRYIASLSSGVKPMFIDYLTRLNCIPKLSLPIFLLILQQLVFKKNYGSIKFLDKLHNSMENNNKYN